MVSYIARKASTLENLKVLILIVVEDGLVRITLLTPWNGVRSVLILIVVEDGLVLNLIRLF